MPTVPIPLPLELLASVDAAAHYLGVSRTRCLAALVSYGIAETNTYPERLSPHLPTLTYGRGRKCPT